MADLQGVTVKTWYYRPGQIKEWSKNDFKCVSTRPIGLALPPSYLEKFLIKRPGLLHRLDVLEKKLNHFEILSGMADHYLIDLRLK